MDSSSETEERQLKLLMMEVTHDRYMVVNKWVACCSAANYIPHGLLPDEF